MIRTTKPLLLSASIALSHALAGCADAPALDSAVEVTDASLLKAPCAGSPYASIQAAIDATPAGGTVTVCSGTFYERLTIPKSLTLKASSGASVTTIDAQDLGKAIQVTGGGTVVIDGFTVINGKTTGTGANVYCTGSGLTLKNSVLKYGDALSGGGVGAKGCWGSITSNTIVDNSATNGGGVFVDSDSMPITYNDILDNHAVYAGGGVYVDGNSDVIGNLIDGTQDDVKLAYKTIRNELASYAEELAEKPEILVLNKIDALDEYGAGGFMNYAWADVLDNTFSFNSAVDDGGGLYMNYGGGVVDGTEMVDNYSDDDGGGLRLKLSKAVITNNTISRNLATNIGGGVRISHDATTISGNTITDNEAYYKAGGIALYESASDFTDNVVTGNEAPQGGGLWIAAGWDDVLVEDCYIANNTADGDGGNVYINLVGQTVTLRRVDLVDGTANQGGGLYALESDVKVENTTFWKNDAWTAGGGAYLAKTTGSLTNDVFWANTGPGGSGIRITDGVAGLTVKNTAVQSNTGSAGMYHGSGTVPTWKYNNVYGNTSSYYGMSSQHGINGNLNVTSLFVNPTAGDFHLAVGSKLINFGDPAIFDTNGTRSDMGIYGGPYGW